MVNWWRTQAGAYVNPEHCVSMYPIEVSSGTWVIRVHIPTVSLTSGANPESDLAGTYTSETDAIAASQRLIAGIDPSNM